MPNLTLELPALHEGQHEIWHHPARFQIIAAGRRYGKTRLGALKCIEKAAYDGFAWWVAPTYPMASIGWRLVKRIAMQIPGTTKNEVEHTVTLPRGGVVQVRSADKPNSLRGEGLDFVVIDECAFVKEDAWTEAIRPALSDKKGSAYFISTPKGRNWFWRLWMKGREDGEEFNAWRFPTSDNPYIDAAEIEAARQMLPERTFRQEYLAEFLEDGGGIFRHIDELSTLQPQDPIPGHTYVGGVDWGRTNDATCFSVGNATTKEQAALDRFTETGYEIQLNRFRALHERYNVQAWVVEVNSMGGPMVERLQSEGFPVQAFTTTNATKGQLIDALTLALERKETRLLDDEVQKAELQAYEMERLPTSGMIRYSAPEGMHDDTVMALALMWRAMGRSGTGVFF